MATTLAQQASISADSGFQNACEMSARAAAIAISSEATNTADHANRVAFARTVLVAAPGILAPMLARNVATQPSILSAQQDDATINNVMSSIWNAMAGVV